MSGHSIGLSRDLDIYIGLRGAGGRNWLKIEVPPMQKRADFFGYSGHIGEQVLTGFGLLHKMSRYMQICTGLIIESLNSKNE